MLLSVYPVLIDVFQSKMKLRQFLFFIMWALAFIFTSLSKVAWLYEWNIAILRKTSVIWQNRKVLHLCHATFEKELDSREIPKTGLVRNKGPVLERMALKLVVLFIWSFATAKSLKPLSVSQDSIAEGECLLPENDNLIGKYWFLI